MTVERPYRANFTWPAAVVLGLGAAGLTWKLSQRIQWRPTQFKHASLAGRIALSGGAGALTTLLARAGIALASEVFSPKPPADGPNEEWYRDSVTERDPKSALDLRDPEEVNLGSDHIQYIFKILKDPKEIKALLVDRRAVDVLGQVVGRLPNLKKLVLEDIDNDHLERIKAAIVGKRLRLECDCPFLHKLGRENVAKQLGVGKETIRPLYSSGEEYTLEKGQMNDLAICVVDRISLEQLNFSGVEDFNLECLDFARWELVEDTSVVKMITVPEDFDNYTDVSEFFPSVKLVNA